MHLKNIHSKISKEKGVSIFEFYGGIKAKELNVRGRAKVCADDKISRAIPTNELTFQIGKASQIFRIF